MPPKPRPVRKTSTATSNPPAKPAAVPALPVDKTKPEPIAGAMLPPPQPAQPKAILEPELDALASSLKAAAVKTAQIYGFYADARRLGISHQARHPPRSLTMALGHEVEKYDQLCDSIEYQLHRSIAVLQRDLMKEEQRLKAKATAVSSRTRSKTPSSSPTVSRAPLPPLPGTSSSPPVSNGGVKLEPASMPPPDGSPVQSMIGEQMSPPAAPSRRASVISLSTLQRPFPLKLDLSSSALRIGADEFIHPLASPVTLAPRSARPPTASGELADMPAELMAMVGASASGVSTMGPAAMPGAGSHVDIDLTMSDPTPVDIDLTLPSPPRRGGGALGSSVDKPIELDLDMEMDLFGEDAPPEGMPEPAPAAEDHDILQTLSAVGNAQDIFGSLAASGEQGELAGMQGQPTASGSGGMPNFSAQSQAEPSAGEHGQFDLGELDLSNFDAGLFDHSAMNVDGVNVEDLLKMSGEDSTTQ